jgi:ribosomal protein S18 acetylase RimI-like enzyme
MVSEQRFIVERLDETHDRASFTSGSAALDRYFRQQAGQEQRRGVTSVFVMRDRQQDNAIAGFYTLSATAIVTTTLPPEVSKKLPRYPTLPAILLGRLARDERWRGQGIGEGLLSSAFRRSIAIGEQLGAIFVVVEAKDTAARIFYEGFRFQSFLDEKNKLFLVLENVRREFGL